MDENILIENFIRNEGRFLKVIEFIKNNANIKQDINRFFNSSLLICKSSAKEKIRILYIHAISDLFKYISNNCFNFGQKKAALFLNKIDWVQNNVDKSQRIFKDYNINPLDLMIPVDNVFVRILNEIIFVNTNEKLNQYKDFLTINKFFKEKLGDEFMLIEDLWFWGYFSTKGNVKKRTIEFNKDKFYTAEFLMPTSKNKDKICEFIDLLK